MPDCLCVCLLMYTQELCLKNLQMLESCSLVKMDDGFTLQHTGVRLSIYSIKTNDSLCRVGSADGTLLCGF